jgi:hypothetical protein
MQAQDDVPQLLKQIIEDCPLQTLNIVKHHFRANGEQAEDNDSR